MDPNSFPPQNYSEQKKENTNFFEIWRQIKSYLFEIFKFLWLIIGLAALGGWYMYKYKSATPVTYTASLSFMLNESDQSVQGAIIGNLGFGGITPQSKNALNLKKMEDLVGTRKLITLALLTKHSMNAKGTKDAEDFLINHYLREVVYLKDTSAHNFYFEHDSVAGFNRTENSHLIGAHRMITEFYLERYISNTDIMFMNMTTTSESFSKFFLETLYEVLNNYYHETRTRKQRIIVEVTQKRVDSLHKEVTKAQRNYSNYLNKSNYESTGVYNKEIEVAFLEAKLNIATTTYLGAVNSLELAEMSLKQISPVIELIDKPLYPLKANVPNSFFYMLIGLFGGGALGLALVVGRKFLKAFLKKERAALEARKKDSEASDFPDDTTPPPA